MFGNRDTLNAFCEKIILPNMSLQRESRFPDVHTADDFLENEEEMFEDDPIEYIRRDLEPSTGGSCPF